MSTSIVSVHERVLRNKHRKKSTDEYAWHKRLVGGMVIAVIVIGFGALMSAILAWKYAGSIAIVNDTRIENRYGQVIGRSGSIRRVPADIDVRHLMFNFGHDAFRVYSSQRAMSANYTEALSFFDPKAAIEKNKLITWWAQHDSPLHADGYFDIRHVAEADVDMKSVLQRATVENSGVEYEVDYLITPMQEGLVGQYVLVDVILTPGGTRTDANPGGLDITHISITEQK